MQRIDRDNTTIYVLSLWERLKLSIPNIVWLIFVSSTIFFTDIYSTDLGLKFAREFLVIGIILFFPVVLLGTNLFIRKVIYTPESITIMYFWGQLVTYTWDKVTYKNFSYHYRMGSKFVLLTIGVSKYGNRYRLPLHINDRERIAGYIKVTDPGLPALRVRKIIRDGKVIEVNDYRIFWLLVIIFTLIASFGILMIYSR